MTEILSMSLFTLLLVIVVSTGFAEPQRPVVAEVAEIAAVWSGHPVGFWLLTDGRRQYVAYYDAHRRMTVAMRYVDSTEWVYQVLPEKVNWDSHHYITMAIDKEGYVHLSGNLHNDPLVYFRTTEPYAIRTFERVQRMVGGEERKCTYPQFLSTADGELLFLYRSGKSGDGVQLVNAYDTKTQTWRRLLPTPLFDGLGEVSCYPEGPVLGPDGYLHLVWVWREHGSCETNHHLCYACSKDMVRWETAGGREIALPMTPKSEETIIDPVPSKGGMINESTVVGFDSRGRAIVSYHKFDEEGYTQIYNARFEGGAWRFYQTSDWAHRWYFSGGGTIINDIDLGPVILSEKKVLLQGYKHIEYGDGVWTLDESTLKPTATLPGGPSILGTLAEPESSTPDMVTRWKEDGGKGEQPGVQYVLRWETLPVNRDQPRKDIPEPTALRVYKLKNAELFDPRMSCIHDGYF